MPRATRENNRSRELLDAAAERLESGVSRLYQRHLVNSLRDAYRRKFARMPSPLDIDLDELYTFRLFDDQVIAALRLWGRAALLDQIAGVIGTASASRVIRELTDSRQLDFGELASIVSDAGRQQTFNRELLETTIESMLQGVSVVDRDLSGAGTTVVTVTNDVTGESESVTLAEDAGNPGTFNGTLATTFGTTAGTDNDGTPNTQAGDTVTVDVEATHAVGIVEVGYSAGGGAFGAVSELVEPHATPVTRQYAFSVPLDTPTGTTISGTSDCW